MRGHDSPPDFELSDVVVRFGGLTAVNGLSLHAPAGRITGLIGPNGAGKSTSFNAATGVVRPASGTVRLGPCRLDGLSPARRAQGGLGRTFQRMELFDAMTAIENVAMGPESLMAGRRPWSQLMASPREAAEVRARSERALATCGISDLTDRLAGDLSTGQRRLVELARAVASEFAFLLLDEPSSGLDEAETDAFGDILIELTRTTGMGLLVVEHDMRLVRHVCSYLYVLDFGQLVHQDETAAALASDVVRAAYLGEEAA